MEKRVSWRQLQNGCCRNTSQVKGKISDLTIKYYQLDSNRLIVPEMKRYMIRSETDGKTVRFLFLKII